MLTGKIRSQVDEVWNTFWTGGISNPMEVIEQFTYLLFIKRLDELHTAREKKANILGRPVENPIFAADEQQLRWSQFIHLGDTGKLYEVIADEVFPFMKSLGDSNSAFAAHMKDARFTLPPEKAGLLTKVVDMINDIPMDDRDTKGDLYEYMLSKLASAGQNGQFRTPRHIIKMMVAMTAPTPQDIICDPACGTAGFLVAADEYLRDNHPEIFRDNELRQHYNEGMFHGFDFDSTMLRVATMNMLLHGIDKPNIVNRDSLAEDHSEQDAIYSLILANPPFAGSLDYDATAKDLLQVVKTKKTELLFVALFLRLLKLGGRAAVIVPDGVLFGSSRAHKTLRKMLVEEQKLDGIISMPSGVFKPYAGVSTAIILFTRTDSGGTEDVWFYDMEADGYSLDDKRAPLEEGHDNNNIPDILTRWQNRAAEAARQRTDQSFLVPKKEIAKNSYDLSINRYKEIVYEEIEYDSPLTILAELEALEVEIQEGMAELKGMLG
ncbi:MAG TPA: class I SAM-dependent DNA methyltransferase [Anaerolineae bacterium]|nr:class I SAM-dependent DNA methyltransferase [Anaerolineae bacterium]